MVKFSILFCVTVVAVSSGPAERIVFKNNEPTRDYIRFVGGVGKTKEILTDTLDVSKTARCPNGTAWCLEPTFYPRAAILRAVAKTSSVKILFPESRTTVQSFKVDPLFEDESVLGLRTVFSEIEGSGMEDVEVEDEFENICGVQTEYIMLRAAKNNEGQFRFIVNHPEGRGKQLLQTLIGQEVQLPSPDWTRAAKFYLFCPIRV